jgi:hypothetical protein
MRGLLETQFRKLKNRASFWLSDTSMTECGMRKANNKPLTTDNRQPTTDNRQPTTDNRQPTTDN